jgi:cytoskeletal protein CcmA (bactofilin family)
MNTPSKLAHLEIKGELRADEDLTIEARFEGRIDLRNHRLIVGPDADVHIDAYVGDLVVFGRMTGKVVVARTADIRDTARIEGRLVAPVLGMSEGAQFKGTIDTRNTEAAMHVAAYRSRQ